MITDETIHYTIANREQSTSQSKTNTMNRNLSVKLFSPNKHTGPFYYFVHKNYTSDIYVDLLRFNKKQIIAFLLVL